MRKLDKESIENIAIGATLLGTGGGGDPYVGKMMALNAIEEYGPVTLLDIEEIPDDALIVPSAMMGAPTVLVEKIPGGDEILSAFEALKSYLGKDIYATAPIEAGGVNSMIPLALGARLGLPVIDCDGMGRAFPELQMVTYHLGGVSATPMVINDEKGNSLLLETIDNVWTEKLARNATVVMGGSVMITIYPILGNKLKKWGIANSISFAEQIGKAIRTGYKNNVSPIENIINITKGYKLFKGKITDILRRTEGGFVKGKATLDGIDEFKGDNFELHFQNENLIAIKNNEVVASVPDLIIVLDLETGQPITTEGLKYGYRVAIIGIPCNEKWRTEKGIETVGPKYFGYDIDYQPVEKLQKEGGIKWD